MKNPPYKMRAFPKEIEEKLKEAEYNADCIDNFNGISKKKCMVIETDDVREILREALEEKKDKIDWIIGECWELCNKPWRLFDSLKKLVISDGEKCSQDDEAILILEGWKEWVNGKDWPRLEALKESAGGKEYDEEYDEGTSEFLGDEGFEKETGLYIEPLEFPTEDKKECEHEYRWGYTCSKCGIKSVPVPNDDSCQFCGRKTESEPVPEDWREGASELIEFIGDSFGVEEEMSEGFIKEIESRIEKILSTQNKKHEQEIEEIRAEAYAKGVNDERDSDLP